MGVATLTGADQVSAEPDDGEEHRIITVLSPKGGSGKTTVATNLAVALASRYPRQVVLADLDLQFGDVANVLRLSPVTTIADIASPEDVRSYYLAIDAAVADMLLPMEVCVHLEVLSGLLRRA